MGKLRLSVHRKNEQRKKYGVLYRVRVPRDIVPIMSSFHSTQRSTVQSLNTPLANRTNFCYLTTPEKVERLENGNIV